MNRYEDFKDAEYLDLRNKEREAIWSSELNRRWEGTVNYLLYIFNLTHLEGVFTCQNEWGQRCILEHRHTEWGVHLPESTDHAVEIITKFSELSVDSVLSTVLCYRAQNCGVGGGNTFRLRLKMKKRVITMTMATTDSDSAKHYAELFVGTIPPLSSTIQLCIYLPNYRRESVSFVC